MNIISTPNSSKPGSAEIRRKFMKVKDYLDFDEFRTEMGLSQTAISLIRRNVMQSINHVLWVQSTQQLFILAPALFRRLLHTYICFDIYPETVGVATIDV